MSDKLSHAGKILKLLKEKGKVSNFELRTIAWRYPARVLDLKHEGHLIRSVQENKTLWYYIYDGHEDNQEVAA